MKDMISVHSVITREPVGVRASQVALFFAPTYGRNTGTLLKMIDKTEVEVTESYDQVWRMLDAAAADPKPIPVVGPVTQTFFKKE
jgi:hypothetical protein